MEFQITNFKESAKNLMRDPSNHKSFVLNIVDYMHNTLEMKMNGYLVNTRNDFDFTQKTI